MADFKENVENLNVRQIVMSSVMTAFGLVVALVWKDTIVATVDYLLPNTDDGTLQGMYISAIAVTILVILLAKVAINLNKRAEKELERVQSYFYDDEDEKKEVIKESKAIYNVKEVIPTIYLVSELSRNKN